MITENHPHFSPLLLDSTEPGANHMQLLLKNSDRLMISFPKKLTDIGLDNSIYL